MANAFRATMNGVDQVAVPPNAETKVLFNHVAVDQANEYDAANSRVVPSDYWHAYATITVVGAFAFGGMVRLRIRRNGVAIAEQSVPANQCGPTVANVAVCDVGNSSDPFDVSVYPERALGNVSILGDAALSHFGGLYN